MAEGRVVSRDGVALASRGDVILIVYQLAARLDRTRWLFDQADRFVAERPNGVMALLVILPTADPPDAATRKENAVRLRALGRSLRRMVSACVGDAFRISVARAIMRGLSVVQGFSRPTFVTDTVEEGLTRLLEGATSETPTRELLLRDLAAAGRALGVAPGDWPIPSPDMAAPPPR